MSLLIGEPHNNTIFPHDQYGNGIEAAGLQTGTAMPRPYEELKKEREEKGLDRQLVLLYILY